MEVLQHVNHRVEIGVAVHRFQGRRAYLERHLGTHQSLLLRNFIRNYTTVRLAPSLRRLFAWPGCLPYSHAALGEMVCDIRVRGILLDALSRTARRLLRLASTTLNTLYAVLQPLVRVLLPALATLLSDGVLQLAKLLRNAGVVKHLE